MIFSERVVELIEGRFRRNRVSRSRRCERCFALVLVWELSVRVGGLSKCRDGRENKNDRERQQSSHAILLSGKRREKILAVITLLWSIHDPSCFGVGRQSAPIQSVSSWTAPAFKSKMSTAYLYFLGSSTLYCPGGKPVMS